MSRATAARRHACHDTGMAARGVHAPCYGNAPRRGKSTIAKPFFLHYRNKNENKNKNENTNENKNNKENNKQKQ